MKYVLFIVLLLLLMGFSAEKGSIPTFSLTALMHYNSSATESSRESPEELIVNPYDGLDLEAEAALVLDIQNETIIFGKNESLEWPLASLTKLATALVVEETAQSIDVARGVITFDKEAISEEGDDGFLVGETFYIEDLRDVMLLRSSNDAARAFARWVEGMPDEENSFVNRMNQIAGRLNFSTMYFLNPTGLDMDKRLSGAYGTAEEIARLLAWILKNTPHIFFITQISELEVFSLEGNRHTFQSSAEPILSIPGLIGVKTGFTDLAGGNVVFAFSLGLERHFIVSILGSSLKGRFTDGLKLYEATKEYIRL